MAEISIREMTASDREAWTAMRQALWPDETVEAHLRGIGEIMDASDAWGFVATESGTAVGFTEVSIRKAANGCESQPVPFLEGIWVEPHHRRQGVGRCLIAPTETFLKALGFREFGSDSLIDNQLAHHAHAAWGFIETERVVYFRKLL